MQILALACSGQMKLAGVTSRFECVLALFTRHLRWNADGHRQN
jgi:hypothetical protein